MTYAEAMDRYGSDKPDLRIPLELVEIKDLLKDIEFKVFAGPANDPACRVTALKCLVVRKYRANRLMTTQVCRHLWRQRVGVD